MSKDKNSAPAIITGGPSFRYATAEDVKVPASVARKNRATWKKRLAGCFKLTDPRKRPATLGDRKRAHERLMNRARGLMSDHPNMARIAAHHEQVLAALEDEEALREMSELRAAAASGDGESAAVLAGLVRRSVSNLVMPNTTWTSFFEEVPLGDDEQFACETRVGSQTKVIVMGEDGKTELRTPSNNFSFTMVPLFLLGTDIFEYPLRDVNLGSAVRDQALSSVDLALDLAEKLDTLSASQIVITSPDNILETSFTTTGPIADRHYVARDSVNTLNLPAGNVITLSDNTGSSLPRSAIFRAIIDYVSSWGTGGLQDGDLQVEAIHLASKVASELISEVDIVGGDSQYTNQIQSNGFARVNYAGNEFTIVADNQLDPNSPYAYVRFNQPVGFMLSKESQADVIDDPNSRRREGKGEISAVHPYGFCTPTHWVHRVLAIKWQD